MKKKPISIEIYRQAVELQRIGNRAVRAAQEESRRLGVPNAYSKDGVPYFELPNGEITQENPFGHDRELLELLDERSKEKARGGYSLDEVKKRLGLD